MHLNFLPVSSRLLAFALCFSAAHPGLGQSDHSHLEADIRPLPDKPVWKAADERFSPSSPRVADLNGDGTLDIIQGDIQNDGVSIVTAVDGKTGELMWKNSGYLDLFASARFADFNQDGTPDVVIGGRSITLIAVNGKNGETLWQVEKSPEREMWGNFYSAQLIGDINGDKVMDIVVANGGDQARDNNRQPGLLMIVSGKTGDVLKKLYTPDGQESYMSTVMTYNTVNGKPVILFGTGGETLPGALWKITLDDLITENKDGFKKLTSSKSKGYEAPPAIVDMNHDGIDDYIIQAFDGTVTVINGKTDKKLWQVKNDGFESIATPVPGYFTNDKTPDVFIQLNNGEFPSYEFTRYQLLDGTDGSNLWNEQIGQMSASGAAAIDFNGNGYDEVLFISNTFNPTTGTRTARYHVLDTSAMQKKVWHKAELYIVANPWVGDMDGNSKVDVLLKGRDDENQPVLYRFETGYSMPETVSWGAYMGTQYDGHLQARPNTGDKKN